MAFTLQELAETSKERQWKEKGVPEEDIFLSRMCGMDAQDVSTFRRITRQQSLLIIVRCPKRAARIFHGILPAKPQWAKDPTGPLGVGDARRGTEGAPTPVVSDYDLMGAWRRTGGGYQKIGMSAQNGASRGPWSVEGMALVRQLNNVPLASRIQHGAQDDYHSPLNRGVRVGDYFAAFNIGVARYLESVLVCAAYYKQHNLVWPYLADGRHIAAK
jgi:hypothetical protein